MSAQPLATYRLQLRPGFGFDEVAAIAGYLRELGISHAYCSPCLQAAPGSQHGYDVVDHRCPNAELGGAAAHGRMCETLRSAGLGQLLDIVPNHMAVTPQNPWWWDVLENGPASRYASFFDVEWAPPEERLRNRVMLPVLGDHVGRIIDRREIRLARDGGSFTLHYHEHCVPAAPRSLCGLLVQAANRLQSDDLGFIADALNFLPLPTMTDQESVDRRHRDKEVLRQQLARLCAESPAIGHTLDAVVAELNDDPDALDAFLAQQNCRLAFWKSAAQDLGYRRFFDVSSLVALRVEDERVFEETHGLVMKWLSRGVIDGVRIDHPDGLRDPEYYLGRLRRGRADAWIVVEKILERDERLPSTWPVDGSTGYDFLNLVAGLFVHPAGERELAELYASFTATTPDYAALVLESKHRVMRELLGSDLNRLSALFLQVCERHRRFRDYTRHEVHDVLRETLAALPVYRTYVRPQGRVVGREDEINVREAIRLAQGRRPDLDGELFRFFGDILLLRVPGEVEDELAGRFQQLSSAVMAKGVEDTAFYNYHRLAALNEVGGDPGRFGASLEEFHRRCEESRRRWPLSLLATSTHDTKRSEDVRSRLWVLSEPVAGWREAVLRLGALAQPQRQDGLPDRNTEYLYYQTLVGAWPISTERVSAYMQKAAREAKTNTSWRQPDQRFEDALARFIERTLADDAFVAAIEKTVSALILPGRLNSLSQTLLKLTAPGVPDIYQGCELWDLSLVDPDNRRPVDFELRRRALASLEGASPEAVLAGMDEGLPKLWLIRQALSLRRSAPEAFRSGSYSPLLAAGPRADHVIAFVRDSRFLILAPRWPLTLAGDWQRTLLPVPDGRWKNALSGESFDGGSRPVADLLARFPVLVAQRQEPPA
ncbi:MAG: malto-oligosyltrehalose synthase [Deltaproteobacteria bacterium]|nr:malto-oligosyltrehalose synthase [Deltaproteobacteria bacterium]